jgi:hypothetical protein
MENKIKAGDVYWNDNDGYGRIYLRCDSSYPDMLRMYLFNASTTHWESAGLSRAGKVIDEKFKLLYNIDDVTKLSREALDEEYRTRP